MYYKLQMSKSQYSREKGELHMFKGLSLSFCVSDIVRGIVKEENVEKIVSGTAVKTDTDWEELLQSYCRIYWFDFPEKARALVARLRQQGKIEQPRLQGHEAHNIAEGHWVVNGRQTRKP